MPIVDDESLQDFLVVPDTVRSVISLLEMYIKSEVVVVSEPSSDLTNSFSYIRYHTEVLTQNTQPQIDVPSNNYGHGLTNVSISFSVEKFSLLWFWRW